MSSQSGITLFDLFVQFIPKLVSYRNWDTFKPLPNLVFQFRFRANTDAIWDWKLVNKVLREPLRNCQLVLRRQRSNVL